jgi:hypothetical protein
MLLTAAQTMMGVAVLLALRFPRWAAWTLLALFLVQFPLTDTNGRLVLAGIYLVLAAAALVWHRQTIIPTLLAPFRSSTSSQSTSEHAPGPAPMTSRSDAAPCTPPSPAQAFDQLVWDRRNHSSSPSCPQGAPGSRGAILVS